MWFYHTMLQKALQKYAFFLNYQTITLELSKSYLFKINVYVNFSPNAVGF